MLIDLTVTQIARGVAEGAAAFVLAVWDQVASSPKLQVAAIIWIGLMMLPSVGGRRTKARFR